MNQWELKANTRNRRQGRENTCDQVTIGFGFASDWLSWWRKFFKPITERSKAKPKQFSDYVWHSIENCSKELYFLPQYFFHNRNAVEVGTVIREAYRLQDSTPAEVNPKRMLEPFIPLTRGQYPIFNKYPKFIVDYQVNNIVNHTKDDKGKWLWSPSKFFVPYFYSLF